MFSICNSCHPRDETTSLKPIYCVKTFYWVILNMYWYIRYINVENFSLTLHRLNTNRWELYKMVKALTEKVWFWHLHYIIHDMASSVSRQEESNPALWLATQAGQMELSCPLGITRRVPQEKFPRKPYNKSFNDFSSQNLYNVHVYSDGNLNRI